MIFSDLKEGRKYTFLEAFIDLIAIYPTYDRVLDYKFLSERWLWDYDKVNDFLVECDEKGYVSIKSNEEFKIRLKIKVRLKLEGYRLQEPTSKDEISKIEEVVQYLNLRAGTKYKANSQATIKLIMARFNEDYTIEDMKRVIDNKCADWIGTEWEKFLRFQTLFSPTKFEAYLNQKINPRNNEQQSDTTSNNKEQNTNNENIKEQSPALSW